MGWLVYIHNRCPVPCLLFDLPFGQGPLCFLRVGKDKDSQLLHTPPIAPTAMLVLAGA